MNLPKELQNLIYEFNVEHRPKMREVMNEYAKKQKKFINRYYRCQNCHNRLSSINKEFSTNIYWNKYNFCSELCLMDGEYEIRKCYKRSLRLMNYERLRNELPLGTEVPLVNALL
jgi:hypothetical protein